MFTLVVRTDPGGIPNALAPKVKGVPIVARVQVQVFGADNEVIPHGSFDTGAEGVATARRRGADEAEGSGRSREARVRAHVLPSGAAGDVEQPPIGCEAKAAAQRAEPVHACRRIDGAAAGYHEPKTARRSAGTFTGGVEVPFGADHQPVELPVVGNLTAPTTPVTVPVVALHILRVSNPVLSKGMQPPMAAEASGR